MITNELKHCVCDNNISLQDLFGAGSDTSSTTLNWCMTELIRYPAAMARAQAEVREAFKGKSTITEDDLV